MYIIPLGYTFIICFLFLVGLALVFIKKYFFGICCIILTVCLNVNTETIPINLLRTNQEKGIKIMTFNMHSGGNYFIENMKNPLEFISFVTKNDPDVLCLQEYYYSVRFDSIFKDSLLEIYPYFEKEKNGSPNAVFSKFPIIGFHQMIVEDHSPTNERFKKIEKNCYAQDYYANRGLSEMLIKHENGVFRLFIVHLASNKLSRINLLSKDWQVCDCISEYISSINRGAEERLIEIDWLIDQISSDSSMPTVICGDFNDVAGSKVLKRIQTACSVLNAWWEKGTGLGYTYSKDGLIWFRLDHVLHSKSIKINSINILDSCFSDHYPIIFSFDFNN